MVVLYFHKSRFLPHPKQGNKQSNGVRECLYKQTILFQTTYPSHYPITIMNKKESLKNDLKRKSRYPLRTFVYHLGWILNTK